MEEKLSKTVTSAHATATAIGQITEKIGPVAEETYQEIMLIIIRFIEKVVEHSQDGNRPTTTHSNAWQNAAQAWMSSHAAVIDKLVQGHQHELSLHGVSQELPLRHLAFIAVHQTMLAVAANREANTQ